MYLPKPPEPIDLPLGPKGEARMRFPVVMGWARVGDESILLRPEDIRDGGTFELRGNTSVKSSQFSSSMLLKIEKPKRW